MLGSAVRGRLLNEDVLRSGAVESELLHTYIRVDPLDVLILCVRLAVLMAVTLTVPVVLFPVRHLSDLKTATIFVSVTKHGSSATSQRSD